MESYLDLSPMLQAIQERPSEFEMLKSDLSHIPSRHRVVFDVHGVARVYARCACSVLTVRPEQAAELRTAIAHWEESYWRPLMASKAAARRVAEINRTFAAHFHPRSALRKWWDNVIAAILGKTQPLSLNAIDPKLPEDSDLAPTPSQRRAPKKASVTAAARRQMGDNV